MFCLIYVVVGLFGLYMVSSWRLGKKRLGRALPGPRGLPIIGSILELSPSNVFFKWSSYVQQYGYIYRIKIFGDNMVIINSGELIRKAFGEDPYSKVMNDRARTFFGDVVFFNSSGTTLFPYANDPIYNSLRKGFTKAFHIFGDGRKEFETKIQVELDRLVEEIESNNGQPFEFQRVCRRFIQNVMSVLLRGYPIKSDEEYGAFNDFSSHTDWLVNPVVDALLKGLPFLTYLPTKFRYHYLAVEDAKANLIKMFIEESQETYRAGHIRGYLDFMIKENLRAREEQTPDDATVYNEIRIKTSTLEAIAAALHCNIVTSQNTSLAHLSSLFLLIINHPQYQQKMQAEIDAVIGRDRLPRLEDKALCPLVEAVTMEVHRYITTLPGLLPHLCRSDMEFEGYHIAKGTTLMANTFHVHHDEKIWGDPWTFRPERFLDDSGQLIPYDHPLRKSWIPFGTGRRICLGETLARSRGFLFITTLLQRWNFRLPPGVELSSDPRDGDVEFNLQTCPKPFVCCAVPRPVAKDA